MSAVVQMGVATILEVQKDIVGMPEDSHTKLPHLQTVGNY